MNTEDTVRTKVREGYAEIARNNTSCCDSGSGCCGDTTADPATQVALALGYSDEDLTALPEGSNMGLSCGNPVALASLREGEVVLDLGSGGGFDIFIAGRKVGPTGRAIGVDMTPEMLMKARANKDIYRERTGFDNVEFRLGEIEHLPVADASVDVVISNCVINLSPDKPAVWREIARVLKPGGRVAVSDIALRKPLPEAARASVEALIGCIAGAMLIDDIRATVHEVGLANAVFEERNLYPEDMTDWSDPALGELAPHFPSNSKPNDYAVALNVNARKPATGRLEDGLDAHVWELIAVGASVSGHCQPCLTYHVAKAMDLGISENLVRAAIGVGQMVEKGAMSAMREFSKKVLDPSEGEDDLPCCAGSSSRPGGKCC